MITDYKHLEREFETMSRMVDIYCADHHGGAKDALCESCAEFLEYARVRLDKCPYGATKPTCANCPIHCYKAEQRDQARTIMRYAGPRMLLKHPLLTIAHKIDGLRHARHPKELSREERLKRPK